MLSGDALTLLVGDLAVELDRQVRRLGQRVDGPAIPADIDDLDRLAAFGDFVGDVVGRAAQFLEVVHDDHGPGVGIEPVADQRPEGLGQVRGDLAAAQRVHDRNAVLHHVGDALAGRIGVESAAEHQHVIADADLAILTRVSVKKVSHVGSPCRISFLLSGPAVTPFAGRRGRDWIRYCARARTARP